MENGWLKVVVDQIQEDLAEIKADVKILREERAESKGKMYVIVGVITLAINFAAILLRIHLGG